MNVLDFGRTPLWLVWETVRAEAQADGVELAESELNGLAPLAAFDAVAEHAGAPADAAPAERVLAAGRSCSCATRRRSWPWSSASRGRPRVMVPPATPGWRGLSVLARPRWRPSPAGSAGAGPGGAGDRPPGTAGPASSAASSPSDRPARPPRPCRSRWRRGRDPAARSFSTQLGHGHARPRRPPHPLFFAGRARTGGDARARGASYLEILAAGGGIPPPSPPRVPPRTRPSTSADGTGSARCCGPGPRRSRRSQGTASTWRRSCGCCPSPGGWPLPAPGDVIPTFLGAHAVPPEVRAAHPDDPAAATEAYVTAGIGSSCRPWRPRDRPFLRRLCEAGVFSGEQSRRVLLAARQLGLAVRLHADELSPSGGAELAAELGALSVDHLGAPSARGSRRWPASRPTAGRSWRSSCRPCRGSWASRRASRPASHPGGCARRPRTDFTPGTSPVTSLPWRWPRPW